ncbi:MAG: PilZ domain-containing protein [Gammaproteobacteria bacterium]|nr:PilZ domain-containing protein [Gammaproteobacteria bacterium]
MKRKYIRHPSEVPIEVVQELNPAGSIRPLHDISYGGLCFNCQMRLKKADSVQIRIRAGSLPVEVQGQVVWCRKKDKHFEVGITFTGEDEANRVRMVEQICQIEQYRHKVLKTEGRVLSSQEAAFEWIKKYAANFPQCAQFSFSRR